MRRVVVNSVGKEVERLATQEAIPGKQIQLTIDYDLQQIAEQSLGPRSAAGRNRWLAESVCREWLPEWPDSANHRLRPAADRGAIFGAAPWCGSCTGPAHRRSIGDGESSRAGPQRDRGTHLGGGLEEPQRRSATTIAQPRDSGAACARVRF